MLELEQVTFAYPGQSQSYVFSLSARAGEVISVAGVSGSGKSTLLDLIAGFQKPSAGTITLDGRELQNLVPDNRPVAILFQDNNLFGHLSAGANLALALGGVSKEKKAVLIEAALKSVGLSGFSNHRASELSGGQKQRVALARTLLLNRPILLLDEPFSALDSASAEEMRQLVKTLVRENNWHTIMVTHHDADHAIADKCLSLSKGRLD